MDGHTPSLQWSPTNQRMVTYQKDERFNSFLPHSSPSWILSKAEYLARSILQDGATMCLEGCYLSNFDSAVSLFLARMKILQVLALNMEFCCLYISTCIPSMAILAKLVLLGLRWTLNFEQLHLSNNTRFYGHCLAGCCCHNVKIPVCVCVCHVTSIFV